MAQNFTISWESDGSSQYAVYLADNERFENKNVYLTTRERCNLGGTLIPGTTYYYKVVGENKETKIDSFKVDDNGVRPITVAALQTSAISEDGKPTAELSLTSCFIAEVKSMTGRIALSTKTVST